MKNCEHKSNGLCKIINIYVDDGYCKKCTGNPKPTKKVNIKPSNRIKRTPEERERVWQIHCQCDEILPDGSRCPQCGIKDRIAHIDGHCKQGKW